MSSCPLCASTDSSHFHRDARREYRRCTVCAVVFVPPQFYLSRDAERAVYELHENSLQDPDYRRFLSRLAEPLLARLEGHREGLDFGCGPAPVLAALLEEAGHRVALYDSMFRPDAAVLARRYDFVAASEVVEHLHRPGEVLEQLWELLRPGGWLALMTKRVRDAQAFAGWHYIRDPTHVCFFGTASFDWWAARHGTTAQYCADDVVLLAKPPS